MILVLYGYLLAGLNWAAIRHDLGDWAPAAEIAVAAGTILLAAATFRLARQAKREASKVGEQVTLERQQLEASQRPFILPINTGWNPGAEEPWIMLSNAGSGPGYNVQGALYWPHGIGGGAPIVPTAIPAGQTSGAALSGLWTGLSVPWGAVHGYLRYTDLATTEWQTHFRYHQDRFGHWSVEVLDVGKTEDLGEPIYTLDAGWQNPRGGRAP
jgi:hypothetical protein